MSEQRFSKVWITEDGDIAITDDGVDLIFTGDAFLIFLNELAEKEATINELKEENKKLIEDWEFSFRTEMAHHRFAEKELQEKIREKQATIQSLKEENRKLKNIHWY